jgi:hypothetical protein
LIPVHGIYRKTAPARVIFAGFFDPPSCRFTKTFTGKNFPGKIFPKGPASLADANAKRLGNLLSPMPPKEKSL